jgi:hypothetical protein
MAEAKVESREGTWQRWLPWTEIFRAFWVALDLNNLLLAAGGILVMCFWWWFWAIIFTAGETAIPPSWETDREKYVKNDTPEPAAWIKFRKERQAWNLMHEAAGISKETNLARYELADIADTVEEYNLIRPVLEKAGDPKEAEAAKVVLEKANELAKEPKKEAEARRLRHRAPRYALLGRLKPAGRLSVSPWSEDRGPNPFLLVTGQAGIPWEAGHFWEWFATDQVPVMLEPLVKLARPIIYLLSPRNTFMSRVYFLLVTLCTLVTWSIFGGAISRRVVVQLATGEKIFATEALGFTFRHLGAYLTAPLIPLGIVTVILIILFLFGIGHMIPIFGDIVVSGLFWPVPLILGLIMTILLVGLVAWPLMAATISADGSDGWEAFTRAYGCLLERPWHCAWYSLVAIAYGGVVIFFVGFISSMMIYLADWGVNAAPATMAESRETSFLFVHAPKSFGWRELLLEGTRVPSSGADVVHGRETIIANTGLVGGVTRSDRIDPDAYDAYLKTMSWWNKIGAWLVAFWLGLAFLLVLGFGYALFWTSTSIIYLLLRRGLDTSEMDDIYMEQEEFTSFRMPATAPATAPAATPAKASTSLLVVEAPRAAPAPAPAPAPVPMPAPESKPAPAPFSVPDTVSEDQPPLPPGA